jgi:alkylation response protein AidB-like acyl-CoA dehydrogenase
MNNITQTAYLNLPNNNVLSTENNPQISIEKFIERFKSTLKIVFHEENNIDTMGITRGISSKVLGQIMDTNPLSVSIPTEYGGRGGIVRENLQLLSAASYESLSLSLTLGINSALFLQPFAKYGQNASKPEIFGRFMNNQNMGGLMITEPGYGSDALNMQTSFTEQSNHFHVKGTKHWAGLTGQADYWLITARKQTEQGGLQRDIDFFVCDNTHPEQKIVVEERFENLGLYQIPYGRNILDVKIPKFQRLIPQTNGIQMMLDLLHRSRLHFPGMGLGFVKRMLDEAIAHCQQRLVGGRSLFSYDQVQQHLARLQANFTIISAFSKHSSGVAGIENDLTGLGQEANIIKTVTTDLMQDSSQTLLTLVGAKGYKLNHISGRGTVDSRPFMIFEGSNDILYAQIGDAILKSMKTLKETTFLVYLAAHKLTENATAYVKDLINFAIDLQMPQRKLVELGRVMSRVASMDMVLKLGDAGFRNELVENAISMLRQEITTLVSHFAYHQPTKVVEDYESGSSWFNYSIRTT